LQPLVVFQPIIAAGETPFAMLQDLWINHPDRVFQPIHYSSVRALIASLNEKIIRPAEARPIELVRRKGETMGRANARFSQWLRFRVFQHRVMGGSSSAKADRIGDDVEEETRDGLFCWPRYLDG
jgi:hypothetical protein